MQCKTKALWGLPPYDDGMTCSTLYTVGHKEKRQGQGGKQKGEGNGSRNLLKKNRRHTYTYTVPVIF
jgi:hypothetical protein